jgi:hypothetical protein
MASTKVDWLEEHTLATIVCQVVSVEIEAKSCLQILEKKINNSTVHTIALIVGACSPSVVASLE